jgi:hypothetical protein
LTITQFFSFVSTQFGRKVKSIQCDNGCEFDNSLRQFFLAHSVQLRMSCPYTYTQNGKVRRILRITNNIVHTLLFQTSMSPQYWVESLHTATYLLNRLSTKTITTSRPYIALDTHRLPTSISGSLGVPATPTYPRQPCISLLLIPPGVSSSAIPRITKGITTLSFHQPCCDLSTLHF